MQAVFWIILIIVNCPIYYYSFKLIFDSTEDFLDSVRYALTPDIISWVRGEGWDDFAGEWKLMAWLFVSIGAVCLEAYLFGMF